MFLGFSAKQKDTRIDKIARKQGVVSYEIFYSPISIWVFFALYLFVLALISLPITDIIIDYWYCLIGYFAVGYLISAYLNNSFIVTEKELIVINPNFPFNRFKSYTIDSIQKVKIDNNKWLSLLAVFMIFENNYVQIGRERDRGTFYCNGLNIDAYDENFTEKTLDDFSFSLRKRGLSVELNIA